jgi:hypothetical protein
MNRQSPRTLAPPVAIMLAFSVIVMARGDCSRAQDRQLSTQTQSDARRLEIGMPLDRALAMCRADRIECHEYVMAVVPTDGTVDPHFYVFESKRSRYALMIDATRKSLKSPLIIRHLTWYYDWTTLKGHSGSDLMRARDRLVKTAVKTVDLATLARFQLGAGATQRSEPPPQQQNRAGDTK